MLRHLDCWVALLLLLQLLQATLVSLALQHPQEHRQLSLPHQLSLTVLQGSAQTPQKVVRQLLA